MPGWPSRKGNMRDVDQFYIEDQIGFRRIPEFRRKPI